MPERECPQCDGSGDCLECDAEGCPECDQTGLCPSCGGSGEF